MNANPIQKWRRGFTLVEVLISMTICSFLMLAVLVSWVQIVKSFVSISNYSEMNSMARAFLEQFARDVQTATDVPSYTTTSVTLQIPSQTGTGSDNVIYTYSAGTTNLNGSLTRQLNVNGLAAGTVATVVTNISSVNPLTFTYIDNANNTVNITNPTVNVQYSIKQLQVSLNIVQLATTASSSSLQQGQASSASEYVISAQFTMRSKLN